MTADDWEARYWGDACVQGREPSAFLVDHVALLPRGRALDVAMGEGRNAVFLAENGFEVVGVDRSPRAVEQALAWAADWNVPLRGVVADLEAEPLPAGPFDLVVVCNYLQRSLFGPITHALGPGGILFYETYTSDHARWSDMRGEFLLEPNELLRAFALLRVMVYRELDDPERRRSVASLLARKPP